jgi:hypothetical protein
MGVVFSMKPEKLPLDVIEALRWEICQMDAGRGFQ